MNRTQTANDHAADFLARCGWSIIDRDARPCKQDRRCKIDIVARPADKPDVIVFVEVRTHSGAPQPSHRYGPSGRKRSIYVKACSNWILRKKYHGDFRFDVVNVYDVGGVFQCVDHVEDVRLYNGRLDFLKN